MKNKPSPLKFFGTLGAIGAGLAGAGAASVGAPGMGGLAGIIGANPRKGGFIEMLRRAKERKRVRKEQAVAAQRASDYAGQESLNMLPPGMASVMGGQSNNFVLNPGQRLWHNPGSNIAEGMDFTNLNNKLAMQGPGWGFRTGNYDF